GRNCAVTKMCVQAKDKHSSCDRYSKVRNIYREPRARSLPSPYFQKASEGRQPVRSQEPQSQAQPHPHPHVASVSLLLRTKTLNLHVISLRSYLNFKEISITTKSSISLIPSFKSIEINFNYNYLY